MIWQVPRIWNEGDVWILGGGPSVTTQFGIPSKIIAKVISKESPPNIYSPFMSFLHDKHVIGINVSYLIGNWVDMVFFGDSNFFLSHEQSLSTFPGIKISCHPNLSNVDWVKYTPKDTKRRYGISNNPKAVGWNGNSGAAAISIAAHTGAKRIFLLGFDMNLDASQNQHWHDFYHNNPNKGYPFDRHLQGFPYIARDARNRNLEIINVSPNSAINDFKKMSLKEVTDTYYQKELV